VERKYFSPKNGAKIDAIRIKIEEWFKEGYISDDEYFYLLTSLLLAVQKVANISGTYGAFNKFWDPRAYKPLTLKYKVQPLCPSPKGKRRIKLRLKSLMHLLVK